MTSRAFRFYFTMFSCRLCHRCKSSSMSEKVDPSYVSRVMNLNLLSPEIVKRILDDELDTSLSFNDFCIGMPSIWNEQMQRAKIDQINVQDDLTAALPP